MSSTLKKSNEGLKIYRKKVICCSQNLNYINKEIRIKNDYSKSVDDQEDKKNKNDKDNNINTDDFRI